jgi:protein CpxP
MNRPGSHARILMSSSVTKNFRPRLIPQPLRHEDAAKKERQRHVMKMHKFSLMAALVAGVLLAQAPTLLAQDSKPARPEGGPRTGQRGEMVKERLAKLSEELQLTADQKTKIEAVLKEQAETLRGLREAAPEERREKMQAARTEINAKVKSILTAEQYAKWEKLREERGPRGQGRRGGPGGPGADKPEKH